MGKFKFVDIQQHSLNNQWVKEIETETENSRGARQDTPEPTGLSRAGLRGLLVVSAHMRNRKDFSKRLTLRLQAAGEEPSAPLREKNNMKQTQGSVSELSCL